MDNETKDAKKRAETTVDKAKETVDKTNDKSETSTGELDSDGFPKAANPSETPTTETDKDSKSDEDEDKKREAEQIKKYKFQRRYMSGKWIGWNAIITLNGKTYKMTITKPKIAEFLKVQSSASYSGEDNKRHFDTAKLIEWVLDYCAFAMPDGSIKTKQTLDDFDDDLALFTEVSNVITLVLNSFSGN